MFTEYKLFRIVSFPLILLISTAAFAENDFAFSGWVRPDKMQWQGPSHDNLVFSWYVPYAVAESKSEYLKLIKLLRKNGTKEIGYYYSATTCGLPVSVGEKYDYPERIFPFNELKFEYLLKSKDGRSITWYDQKNRYYLDIGSEEVQSILLSRIISQAKNLGSDFIFLDNLTYFTSSPSDYNLTTWSNMNLSLIKSAYRLIKQNNLKLVININSPFERWNDFIPYCDGITYELGCHPKNVQDVNNFKKELETYINVLEQGKALFLHTDKLTYNGKRWDEEGIKVALTALIVRASDQTGWANVHVCLPRFETWPNGGWYFWPEQLGKPVGRHYWKDTTVFRKFENGEISIKTGEFPKFSIKLNF